MENSTHISRTPLNKGRHTGQKKALKSPEILKVRFNLELKSSERARKSLATWIEEVE